MITVSSNAKQIVAAYQIRRARCKDLTEPLTKAGARAVSAAKRRFTTDIGWAPNAPSTIARKGSSRPGIDSGKLRNSITASEATATSIRVGTNLKYGRWFQEGTGIYAGHSAWVTAHRTKLASSLGAAAMKRYVTHKGQPPRPFLFFDDPLRAAITKIFVAWLRKKPE